MVAIKSAEADRFIARDAPGFALFLLFGPDTGLVSERARRLLALLVDDPGDPFQLVRLKADDLADDAPRLVDEAMTVPLFGGKRAIHVDGGGKEVEPAVALFLDAASPCPAVIEAGALKRDAPLRKLVERSRMAAAIECYPDDERDLARLIEDEAAAAGMTIDPDAKHLLASMLGADRLASRSEIGKLMLYAHGAARIEVADVESAVADASAQATDDALDAAFSGNLPGLDAALRRLKLGPVEAGLLLGAALRHATLLHRTKLAGGPAGDGAPYQGFLPARRKAALARQVAGLSSDAIARAIVRLGEAIGQARRDARLAESHAVRALWATALAARPRRPG